jgi:3alpha(or 20beta)-hydroxysteroid dehydrogenase
MDYGLAGRTIVITGAARGQGAAEAQASVQTTLAGRAGRADEVADVVVFLLSARAAYLNGQDIPVDGGFSSHGGAKSITDALAQAHPGTW